MVTRFADGRANLRISKTTAAMLVGEEDLTDWDDDEIESGMRRNKTGTWPTRRPLVVPQAVHDERIRRTMKAAHNLLRESTYVAVALLRTVVEDEAASYNYRLQEPSGIASDASKSPGRLLRLGSEWVATSGLACALSRHPPSAVPFDARSSLVTGVIGGCCETG